MEAVETHKNLIRSELNPGQYLGLDGLSNASRGSRSGVFRAVIRAAETTDSDDMTPITRKDREHQKLLEKRRYQIGYMNWYWTTKGFWRAFYDFWGAKFFSLTWLTAIRNIGSAIGGFLIKRFVFDRLGLQEYYTFKS